MSRLGFALLLSVVLWIYVLYSNWFNGGIFSIHGYARYGLLIDALVHQRLDVHTKNTFDLSLYHHKLYLYWGPSAVLFIFPFYLIGMGANDSFYNLVSGVLNVALFFWLCQEAVEYFRLRINPRLIYIATLSFALGSLNLSLSVFNPGVWQTNQLVSVTYLLLFFLFSFKYLNRKKTAYLIAGTIFFNLAWFSRLSLITAGLLFVFLKLKNRRDIAIVVSAFLVTLVLFFAYNWARFLDIFETGLKYQLASKQYLKLLGSGEALTLAHIPINLKSYFFSLPQLDLRFLSLKFDSEIGTSVFLTYPLLLLLFFLPFKKIPAQTKKFILISSAIVLLNLALLFLYFPTIGIKQNNRYFYDVTPTLFLIIVLTLSDTPVPIQYLVLFWGVIINFGVLFF